MPNIKLQKVFFLFQIRFDCLQSKYIILGKRKEKKLKIFYKNSLPKQY